MVALAWLATLAGCTAWVKTTQIGPVVMIINDQRGWGVHAGDSWVLAGLAPMAAITVLHVVRRTRRLS